MKNNSQLSAKVRFLTSEEGGRVTPASSGIKPNMKVGDVFTSSFVWGDRPGQVFDLGVEYSVSLELPMWNDYKQSIYVGMSIQMNEGSRVIARGTIEKILVA